MVTGPIATTRSPFPVPYGWFTMAYSEQLKIGDVVPLEYFDRHLVLWRDNDGEAHVNDAFCPPRARGRGRELRDRGPVPLLAVRR